MTSVTTDLPDYTRLVTVNVNIPEVQIGAVNIGMYKTAPADLPDGSRTPLITDVKGRLIVVQYAKDRTITGNVSVIPRPMGGSNQKGSLTTTAAYQTVAEITVTNTKTFHLAKIAVSCKEDVWIKVRWNSTDISIEYMITGGIPFTDWFPWNWYPMLGDGAKKVDIQAKYDSAAETVFAELVGEEV